MELEFSVFWETVSAVNRSSFSWLEWNLGLNAAVRTNCWVHFSGATAPASETTTVVISASPIAVSSSEGMPSSVTKTHFCFTSAYSGYTFMLL